MRHHLDKQPNPMKTLQSAVIKTEPISWRSLQFLQENNFKNLSDTSKQKLKNSLLANQFSQPFYVWQDPKTDELFCLDGKHRSIILEEFITEGVDVPEKLPATFIKCKNKKEASTLVLQYSSIYAKVTQQGLFDFMEAFKLDFDELTTQIDLPDFSMPRFEQQFDPFNSEDIEEVAPIEAEGKKYIVQQGDLFILNNHRIVCSSFQDKDRVNELMQNEKARIVNCDPPYNLDVDFFTNKWTPRHKNFALAGGEMSDQDFVIFLSSIMEQSVQHTLKGSVHYMFMDFRHVWHITEAARSIYKSAEPKQLCVWHKSNIGNGSFYRAQHELCFIFKQGDKKEKHISNINLKDRIRSNVWQYPSASSFANPDRLEVYNHPTPKPVAMIADSILDSTNKGDIVIDWFLGSGTALMACEQTERKGRFTEIEPKYVQSAIIRYINYCNKQNIPIQFQHLNGSLTLEDFI